MTDKITLELTLDELKLIDKYVELNDETESVFDKIKGAYPQPKMTLQQEGDYAVVSYNDTTYYRFMNETTFAWYIKKGVSVTHPVPTLVMVTDAETERLLDGLYYNYIEVKKEKEQQTKSPVEEAYKDWWGQYPETGTWDIYDEKMWQGFQAGYEFAYAISTAKEVMEKVQEEQKGVVSSTKRQTLYDLIADWWDEIFLNNNEAAVNIESLVDDIEKWLPKEHDTNSYKWNQCIRTIKENLR